MSKVLGFAATWAGDEAKNAELPPEEQARLVAEKLLRPPCERARSGQLCGDSRCGLRCREEGWWYGHDLVETVHVIEVGGGNFRLLDANGTVEPTTERGL